MKTFIGYYIIGANTREDAENEKGLMLWSPTKPNAFKRWLNENLLGIYWIDKERIVLEKGKTMQSQVAATEMNKVATAPSTGQTPRKPRQTPRKPAHKKD